MALEDLKFKDKTIAKLEKAKSRYLELNDELAKLEVINDQNLYRTLGKEHSDLEDLVRVYDKYNNQIKQYNDSLDLYNTENDADLKEMAKEDLDKLIEDITISYNNMRKILIPPDPLANKNIIVEIRAGTGGEEAALFCSDLFRMYTRYSELKKWKVELIDSNETGLGGYKEIIFSITGKNVYEHLRYEYGGHRVQRIPTTETNGRIHTSAVTVAILPEMEDIDIEIKQEDLRIDLLRASGAGGQHINKTESAVRLTHIPTGIVVKCQDNRSQGQNKASAMRVLRSRLFEMEQLKLNNERAETRKEQVGSGDRSQKVRTYNFPQNRVTDHRINMTLYNLESFMDGNIDEVIEALKINYIEEKLKEDM